MCLTTRIIYIEVAMEFYTDGLIEAVLNMIISCRGKLVIFGSPRYVSLEKWETFNSIDRCITGHEDLCL